MQGGQQQAGFVLGVGVDLAVQLAGGHAVGGIHSLLKRPADRLGQPDGGNQGNQYRNDGRGDQGKERPAIDFAGVVRLNAGHVAVEFDQGVQRLRRLAERL